MTRQSLSALASPTQIATAITVHTIVSSLSDGSSGIPVTDQQRQAQAGTISSRRASWSPIATSWLLTPCWPMAW